MTHEDAPETLTGDLLDVPLPIGLTPDEVAAEAAPGSLWVSKSYAEELLKRGLELREQVKP